jgi:hypothetical protein
MYVVNFLRCVVKEQRELIMAIKHQLTKVLRIQLFLDQDESVGIMT